MLAVTIVSIALSSTVALAAIASSVWQQRQGFRHERGIDDRKSVRAVLSDAATILHRAEYAIDEAHAALTQFGASMFDEAYPQRIEPYRALEAVGRDLDAALGQIRILVGPEHPVTVSFSDADEAFLDAFRALGLIRLEDPAIKGTYVEREIREMVKDQREQVASARDAFKVAQVEFARRAHATAGADLPLREG